ncbi:FMN-binding negative transcriptional regulator (plasmid) [Pseudoalteromonas sp. T1lg65]|uniref:FMN-binding negative transcriptional regulator n=1 Tax=Pseudoalteromonas sp. T1lg65 TaxID=2077101 RepID=UPI003F7A4C80
MSYPNNYVIEHDEAVLKEVINAYPLATISVVIDGVIETVFLPLTYDHDTNRLIGHAQNSNPLFQAKGNIVHLIFHAENQYLSPSMIPEVKLPTWLYANVIVKGELKVTNSIADKNTSMRKQVTHFEAPSNGNWTMDMLNEKQLTGLFAAITFFEININHIQGYFKLSQNKSSAVREKIKLCLTQQGSRISEKIS